MRNVKGYTVGEGSPLICIPVMERTKDGVVENIRELAEDGAQMIEWRVDAFGNPTDLNAIRDVLEEAAPFLKKTIFVYTFRSKAQGGLIQLTQEQVYDIHQIAAETRVADFIDVELFSSKQPKKEIAQLQRMGAGVIVSHHDFDGTPSPEIMDKLLKQMNSSGADIVKLAVMPRTEKDVLALLFSTCHFRERYPGKPVITMSMGGLGSISRIAGETFGSCVTFGTAGRASAPGQLPVEELKHILAVLHDCREGG